MPRPFRNRTSLGADALHCTAQTCRDNRTGRCFLSRARRRADGAHLLVVNHALLLADQALESKVLPEYDDLIVDEARSSHRRAPLEAVATLKPEVRSGQQGSEEKLILERVVAAIQHDLTSDQRHVIILRFLEEFSLRETAAILGKDVGHVKVIQSRALAKLRKVFEYDERKPSVPLPRVDGPSSTLRP